MKWLIPSFLSLLVFLCTGCGPNMGMVSGVVTYQGKPLPGGIVTFRPADGGQNSVAFVLPNDGKFTVTLPKGEVAICIDNREFEPQQPTVPPNMPALKLSPEAMAQIAAAAKKASTTTARESARYVRIPERYYAVETSLLKMIVKGGDQTEDIVLKE